MLAATLMALGCLFPAAPAARAAEGAPKVRVAGASARDAFRRVRAAGLGVVKLGRCRSLLVPAGMRHRPVDARKLVEAVARRHDLKVHWASGGRVAVLHAGADGRTLKRLLADLKSGEVETREQAAWRAGWVADARVVPALVAAAGDADAGVSRQARDSLWRLGWPAVLTLAGEKALPLLEKSFSSRERYERDRILQTIDTAGPVVMPFLEGLLKVSVTKSVLDAVGRTGGSRAVTVLKKLLGHEKPWVRQCAAVGLACAGEKEGWAWFEKVLSGDDLKAAQVAARLLQELKGDRLLPILRKAFASGDSRVRISAAAALERVGSVKALPLIRRALADKEKLARWSAARALAISGNEDAWKLLEAAVASGDRWTRHGAISALGFLGGERVLPLLEKALKHGERDTRLTTARALGQLGGDRAADLLASLLKDRESRVASGAARALGQTGSAKAIALMGEALKHGSNSVREAAVTALGESGSEEALPLLKKALGNKGGNVRWKAVASIGRIGGGKALALLAEEVGHEEGVRRQGAAKVLGTLGGPAAVELLVKALNDKNQFVRGLAATSLAKLGGRGAREALRARCKASSWQEREKLVKLLKKHFPAEKGKGKR